VVQAACEREKSREQLRDLSHEEEGTQRRDEDQNDDICECHEFAGEYAALRGHAKSAEEIYEIGRLRHDPKVRKYQRPRMGMHEQRGTCRYA
jgi:hypothetical protein